MFFFFPFQDPAINIAELKDIHSEINLTVPDPILVPHLHDGLETVRQKAEFNLKTFMQWCRGGKLCYSVL